MKAIERRLRQLELVTPAPVLTPEPTEPTEAPLQLDDARRAELADVALVARAAQCDASYDLDVADDVNVRHEAIRRRMVGCGVEWRCCKLLGLPLPKALMSAEPDYDIEEVKVALTRLGFVLLPDQATPSPGPSHADWFLREYEWTLDRLESRDR
jgi:hypothetical protein